VGQQLGEILDQRIGQADTSVRGKSAEFSRAFATMYQ
jgi:hypothetical protein